MFFSSGAKGISWHDRGDLAASDYQSAALTKDSDWHDLDISAIVGTGQKLVLIRCTANDSVGGKKGELRTKGNANNYNVGRVVTQAAAKTADEHIWVYTNANGVVEYYFDTATWYAITIQVLGWFA